jgi:hypothetical protein
MIPGELIGDCFRLALARDLERVYAQVLREPAPEDLQRLLYRVEAWFAASGAEEHGADSRDTSDRNLRAFQSDCGCRALSS